MLVSRGLIFGGLIFGILRYYKENKNCPYFIHGQANWCTLVSIVSKQQSTKENRSK